MPDEFEALDRWLGFADDTEEPAPSPSRGPDEALDRWLDAGEREEEAPGVPRPTPELEALDNWLGEAFPQADDRGVVTKGLSQGAHALVMIFGGAASFTGDVFNDESLQSWGRDIARDYGDRAAKDAQGIPRLDDVFSSEGGFDAFWRWALFHMASGGVTAAPALLVGALGAVASPAIALGAGGAFLYGMGVGDITATQLEERADPDLRWAAIGGVPYAVAERMFGAGAIAARALTRSQKRQLATSFLRRLSTDIPYAMGSEATAEGIQTIITEGTRRLEGGEPIESVLADEQFWRAVGEGAAAGGIAGGPFGAVSAIPGPGVTGYPGAETPPGAVPGAPERPISGIPPETPPPGGGISAADRASPLPEADIARGRDIIDEAAGPIAPAQEVVFDPDTGLPLVGSRVRATSRDLPGGAVEGRVTETFMVDNEPGIAIRDTQGVTHYVDRAIEAQFGPPAPAPSVRQQTRQPTPEPTDEELASPLPTSDIQTGKDIIEDALADTEANKLLSAAGLPAIGTGIAAESPALPGGSLQGQVVDAIQRGDELALVVRDEAGQTHEISPGAVITRLPTPEEVADRADLERIREERDRLEQEATAGGFGGVFQQAEITELQREGVDTFDQLPKERQKPVISAVKTQVSEAQKRQKEGERQVAEDEKARLDQAKDEEAGRKFGKDVYQASQGISSERADEFIRTLLDADGYAELSDIDPERRAGFVRSLRDMVKGEQATAKAADEAVTQAEKTREEEEKAADERRKEQDARLVYRQAERTAFAEAEDLSSDFLAEAEAAVRKEMGVDADYLMGLDAERRDTYLKLFKGKVAEERQRRKAAERTAKEAEREEEDARQAREREEKAAQERREREERKKAEERERKERAAAEAEAKAPKRPKGYGKANKVFTEDAAEKARALLREKLRDQLGAGLDPEMVQAGITLAGYHIEAGARTFAAYSKVMIEDLGEAARPYLRSWYEGVRHYPGFDAEGMTPAAELEGQESAETGQQEGLPATDDTQTVEKEIEDADTTGRPRPREPEPVDDTGGDTVEGREADDGQEPRGERDAPESAEDGGGRDRGADGEPGAAGRRTQRRPRRSDKQLSAAAERGGRARSAAGLRSPGAPGTNYRITEADDLGGGGNADKARRNVEAIRTLKAIEAENRLATPAEQAILVRYTGWGGLKKIFGYAPELRQQATDLKEILDETEYEAARASTLNAHYTAAPVVKAMWTATEKMGFTGGRVLEPGLGIGHFFGLMPEKLLAGSTLQGIEMDPISARIARQLYQRATVINLPYEKVTIPEGFYDLAISNVPFLDVAPADRKYNRQRLVLHDYYFRKTIRMVRPGGLVAFITSKGTMDKVLDRARKLIGEDADLVAAIRLPETAFERNAGTIVTTDIIFLRRKVEGEDPAWRQEWLAVSDVNMPPVQSWGGAENLPLNEYFQRNPDQMLGEMMTRRGRYGDKPEATLVGEDPALIASKLPELVDALPRVMTEPDMTHVIEDARKAAEEMGLKDAEEGDRVRQGQIHVRDGKVYRREGTIDRPVKASETQVDIVERFTEMADFSASLIGAQMDQAGAAEIKALRAKLNKAYAAFVKKHGYIGKVGPRSIYREDPRYDQVRALEKWDAKTRKGIKADIFTRNTVAPREIPTAASSAVDALTISLNQRGKVDVDYMAGLLGASVPDLTAQLAGRIFLSPQGGWQTADEYLSGNVREKLKSAKLAAAADPKYAPNVDALGAAIPEDLKPAEITAKLGASWIHDDDIGEYIGERMNVRADSVRATYLAEVGKWKVEAGVAGAHVTKTEAGNIRRQLKGSVEATKTWGTGRKDFFDLIEHALNGGFPTVRDRIDEKTSVVNLPETEAARAKLQEIKDDFAEWAWADDDRATKLARRYNDEMNAVVLRQYDGSHLNFPGMAADFVAAGGLRKHQRDAVWRVLSNPSTYLAHEVGTGKTLVYLTAAMEARRLGLARKPAIAVLKKNLDQFVGDFRRAYPGANILVIEIPGVEEKRRAAVAQIVTGDWDAVILTHENLGKIGVSAARQQAEITEQVADLMAVKDSIATEQGHKAPGVREMEKTRKRLEGQLGDLEQRVGKDAGMTFEDAGIDFLMVDEAQQFKSLMFQTSLGRQIRGLNPAGSGRSFELFLKSKYLREMGGRFVMGSGTPLSNSIGELFSLSRYLQLDELQGKNLGHFDTWANTFGDASEVLEYLPEGGGYRKVAKFHRFVNVPELMTMVYSAMDFVTAEKAGIERPSIENGKPTPVVLEMTEDQMAFQNELNARAKYIRSSPRDALPDNMLALSTDGQWASIDMRLLGDIYTEGSGSKLPAAVDRIAQLYKEMAHFRGTQLVFLDQRKTTRNTDFNTHDAIQAMLVERGLPADEIAAIHDVEGESNVAKQREAKLFADVNAGKVRVLLATTQKGGTGVNVQERVGAIHHLDVDWNFSGYIQRNGRGIRQGNIVEKEYGWKLRILNYTTEASVDAFKWDKVAGKAKLFERIMDGDLTDREIADLSDDAISASEMVAVTSGDPRIAEFQSLQIDVGRLSSLRRAHDNEAWDTRREIKRMPLIIEAAQRGVAKHEANVAQLEKIESVALFKEGQQPTVLGLADEKTAERLKTAWRATIERAKVAAGEERATAMIAEYRGEGIALPVLVRSAQGHHHLEIELPGGNFSGGGETTAQRKLMLAREWEQRAAERDEATIERAQSDLKKLEKETQKPFPQQSDLDKKEGRLHELRAAFAEEEAKVAGKTGDTAQASMGTQAAFRRNRDDIIASIVELAQRMNPNVDVELVERLFTGDEEARRASGAQDDSGEVAGLYWRGAKLVQVALDAEGTDVEGAAAHELWHSLEEMLTPEEQTILREEFPAQGDMPHEEVTAYAYERWYRSRGVRELGVSAAVRDIFRRIARFFRAIRHMLARRGFKTAESIFEAAERGELGMRAARAGATGPATQAAVRRPKGRKREPILSFEDAETQRQWDIGQLGLKGQRDPMVTRLWGYAKDFGQLWVRSHRHLPRAPQFADAYAYLRQVKAAPAVATEEIVRYLHDLTRGLSAAQLELFTMKAVSDDLHYDVARGLDIPIFHDAAEFIREKGRIDAEIAKQPDLMKLIHRRRRYVQSVKRRMIEAGMLSPDEAANPAYFHHQVLQYAAVSRAFGGQKKVRKPKIFRRKGTKLTINTKLVEAEAEWLFRALVGIETMEQIDAIHERYDTAREIRDRIRAQNKASMDELLAAEVEEVGEDGPIAEKLQQYRRNIAIGFKMIRADESIEASALPQHLRAAFENLMDRSGDGERDFAVIAWIAQNTNTQASGGAGLILKEVNSRRQFLKDTLGKKRYLSPHDLDGAMRQFGIEDRRTWQPDEGRIFFMSKSLPQHVMDRFMKQLKVNLEAQSGHFTNEEVAELFDSVNDQLAVGGKKPQMVLPNELADTLDAMGAGTTPDDWMHTAVARMTRLHKQWLLISPRSYARYNIQNISGDLDGAIAAFPATLKLKTYLAPAVAELWQVQIMRKEPSAAYLEAARRGVFDAGWSINEVYEAEANIGDVMAAATLTEQSLRRVWRFFSRSTTFRENWLRYAMYMAVKDRIAEMEAKHPGKPPDVIMPMVGYGAARAVMVDATTDPLDRAALIARESIGDYGDLSVAGDYLRRHWMWFFSWQEINFKRYMRLGTNIWLTQKGFGKAEALAGLGARVGTRTALWLAFRATIFFVGIQLWNHLMFPDEEDELSEEDRWRLHVILGRDEDGKVVMIRLPGALSDFLSIFGYQDVMQFVYEIQAGRGDWGKLLEEVALAPINRLIQGVTPVLKVPVEAMTGKTVFPKFWEPRGIKDPWRHIFRTFKAEHEYDAILGRPSRGYGDSWIEAVIARREADESAYHFIRGRAYDWKQTVKGDKFQGGAWSDRARALYYWRKALQFGDEEAAMRFRKELRRLKANVAASTRAAHPLGMLSKVDRRRFLRTLTDEERSRLRRATSWYNKTF